LPFIIPELIVYFFVLMRSGTAGNSRQPAPPKPAQPRGWRRAERMVCGGMVFEAGRIYRKNNDNANDFDYQSNIQGFT
jgi:hypothetical protein